MEKRIVLFVVLCVGIFVAWGKLFPPPHVQQPVATTPANPGPAAPAQAGGAIPADSNGAAPATRGPEELVALDTAEAHYVFSSWGGTLKAAKLKEAKFLDKKPDGATSPHDLVRTTAEDRLPLLLSFGKADFAFPEKIAWTVTRPAPNAVTFRAETDGAAVEKRYRTGQGKYQLELDVVVENRAQKAQSHALVMHLFGAQDPERAGGGWLSYASANMEEMACMLDGKVQRTNIEGLLKEAHDGSGAVPWVAADERFFTIALATASEPGGAARRCGRRALDATTGEAFLSLPSRNVDAGKSTTYSFVVFAGPKYRDALGAVRPGGEDVHMPKLINVSIEVLSRPMLVVLKALHGFTGNWGIAIILLTVLVKLLTFYPAHKAMMSGKRMARLAPKLAELRTKYEGDRERLARETMNLYKANGVNMFGGCLPSLLQMPIWIALYSTLSYAVELYRSAFFGYITDLSARDPYFITPLLMGGVMVVQMRMSPAGADPQQQKMMSVMMPVMFTVMSLFLPSGLAVYMLTSYLLGIVHQLVVNTIDKRAQAEAAAAPAKA